MNMLLLQGFLSEPSQGSFNVRLAASVFLAIVAGLVAFILVFRWRLGQRMGPRRCLGQSVGTFLIGVGLTLLCFLPEFGVIGSAATTGLLVALGGACFVMIK